MADPVRFFFDQHMDPVIADALRGRGIDVLTAPDAGRCGYDDPDQLAYAAANGRVVVTFDTDFIGLHNAGVAHAGIVWSKELKYSIGQLIAMLTLVHGVYDADEMVNRLEYL